MKDKMREYLVYLERVRFVSKKTLSAYSRDMLSFHAYLEENGITDLEEITRGTIGGFLRTFKDKSPSAVNRASAAVRGFFRFCRRFDYLAADPSKDIESVPQASRLPAFLMEEDAARLLDSIDGTDFQARRDRAMLEFLYSTGCRVSEAAGLTLDRLDLRNGRAKVLGKGSKERYVFLAGPAVESIKRYLDARRVQLEKVSRRYGESIVQEHLFINRSGGPLDVRSVQTAAKERAAAAGIHCRITPHTFRHSFATACINHGADLRVVQELLGHSSVSTTARYVHVNFTRMADSYRRAFPHAGVRGGERALAETADSTR